MNAIGYSRVSTKKQADDGPSLDSQRFAIENYCKARDWSLSLVEDAGESGKDTNRPGLQSALARLKAGEAKVLVVYRLDRLSRSVIDACTLAERAKREGWSLVFIDMQIDTTTPVGELLLTMLAAFAQMERRIIGQRTKAALARKRDAGVQLGRRATFDQSHVLELSKTLKASQIAKQTGIPASTVRSCLNRARRTA